MVSQGERRYRPRAPVLGQSSSREAVATSLSSATPSTTTLKTDNNHDMGSRKHYGPTRARCPGKLRREIRIPRCSSGRNPRQVSSRDANTFSNIYRRFKLELDIKISIELFSMPALHRNNDGSVESFAFFGSSFAFERLP